jgi:hypothetical protein
MRRILTAISLAVLTSGPIHANDCAAKAGQIVRDLGATIVDRQSTTMIFLKHSGVRGDFTLNCFSPKPEDGTELSLYFENSNHPTDVFMSIVAAAGAIVTGEPLEKIEAGARACYEESKKKPSNGGVVRRAGYGFIVFSCSPAKDTFGISIYRTTRADASP